LDVKKTKQKSTPKNIVFCYCWLLFIIVLANVMLALRLLITTFLASCNLIVETKTFVSVFDCTLY